MQESYKDAIKIIQNDLPSIGDVVKFCSDGVILYESGHKLEIEDINSVPQVNDIVVGVYYRVDLENEMFIVNIEHEKNYISLPTENYWKKLSSIKRKVRISYII